MKAHELQLVQNVAALTPTRLFGMPTEEIFIKMLVAHEHNVPLTSALSTVYVIDKKPVIAPKLTWAKIVGHPELASYEEVRLTDNNGAFRGWRITLGRTNGVKATREFTLEDANRAGLLSKTNWQHYPEQVCQWRALGYAQDVVFADVSQGLYRPEELGADVNESGEPVWSEVTTTIPDASVGLLSKIQLEGDNTTRVRKAKPLPVEPTDTSPDVATPAAHHGIDALMKDKFSGLTTIDALIVAGYSAEAIVVANEGRVPSTAADCIRVAKILLEGQDAQS